MVTLYLDKCTDPDNQEIESFLENSSGIGEEIEG
jgi:hypothetical protein